VKGERMRQPSVEWSQTCDPVGHEAIATTTDVAPWGPVVLASTESRPGAKILLAFRLLRALAWLDPRWSVPPDESALTIHKSALGGPCLFLRGERGPSLSFSHGEGRLWAAMSGAGKVGIDVAYPEEFTSCYPFARAFRAEELECARALCPGHIGRGAALVWSAKEASVKATGAGFNILDPLEVRVGNPSVTEQGILFEVSAGRRVSAWVRKEDHGWLSVAFA